MTIGHDDKISEYQLRRAAGLYWLLDMKQEGVPYKKPLPLNDGGAEIWNMLEKGMTQEEIVDSLICQYSVTKEEATQDVEQFVKQLQSQGVRI